MISEKEKAYRQIITKKDNEILELKQIILQWSWKYEHLEDQEQSLRKNRNELKYKKELLTQENLALKERLVKLDNMVNGLLDDVDDLESLLDDYQNSDNDN